MRFEITDSARADYARLSADEKAKFNQAVSEFNRAADAWVTTKTWPKRFRVKSVQGTKGILEMTWSFSGPDGRATWEWTLVAAEGERFPAVRWRRIGGHDIFSTP